MNPYHIMSDSNPDTCSLASEAFRNLNVNFHDAITPLIFACWQNQHHVESTKFCCQGKTQPRLLGARLQWPLCAFAAEPGNILF